MSYLRTRNGYVYICQKVKDKNGKWKEETLKCLGKAMTSEEEKEFAEYEKLEVGKNISLPEYEKLIKILLEDLNALVKGGNFLSIEEVRAHKTEKNRVCIKSNRAWHIILSSAELGRMVEA